MSSATFWNTSGTRSPFPTGRSRTSFCRQHNVKFAIEAHPGFMVYNPETVIKLREAAGENIGCNFDPSHFWWQGIDPLAAIRYLGSEGRDLPRPCQRHAH